MGGRILQRRGQQLKRPPEGHWAAEMFAAILGGLIVGGDEKWNLRVEKRKTAIAKRSRLRLAPPTGPVMEPCPVRFTGWSRQMMWPRRY